MNSSFLLAEVAASVSGWFVAVGFLIAICVVGYLSDSESKSKKSSGDGPWIIIPPKREKEEGGFWGVIFGILLVVGFFWFCGGAILIALKFILYAIVGVIVIGILCAIFSE